MSNVIHTDTSQSDFQNGVLTDVIATADGILELGDINYSLAGGINLNEVSQEVYKEYCSGLDTYKWYQYGFCISPDGKRMITVSRTLDNTCAAEYGYIRKWEFIDSYDNWQPSNL